MRAVAVAGADGATFIATGWRSAAPRGSEGDCPGTRQRPVIGFQSRDALIRGRLGLFDRRILRERRRRNVGVEIPPVQVHALNQLQLPPPLPALELLLPPDGVADVVMIFVVDKPLDVVAGGEAVGIALRALLLYAPDEAV